MPAKLLAVLAFCLALLSACGGGHPFTRSHRSGGPNNPHQHPLANRYLFAQLLPADLCPVIEARP